jgi:diguanylate cyclase (GGDEF)-like protein
VQSAGSAVVLQFLRDLPVKAKAILTSVVLIGAVTGLGAFALHTVNFANEGLANFRASTLPRVQSLRNIAFEAMEAHAQVFRLVALASGCRADIAELAARRNGIDSTMARVREGLETASRRSDLTVAQRTTILASLTNWENYVNEANEVLDSAYYDAHFGVLKLPELDKLHGEAAREVAALSRLFSGESSSTISMLVAAGESGMRVMILWVVVSVALVILAIGAMTGAVIKPISDVTRAMTAVAAGANAEIPIANRKDELGEMLTAVATFKTSLERRQDEVRLQNDRFDTALNNITPGLVMYDGNKRLIVSNKRYAEMYGIPVDHLKSGMTQEDIQFLRAKAGTDTEKLLDEEDGFPPEQIPGGLLRYTRVRDGRIVQVSHRDMADGGWCSTHKDITDHLRDQEEIRVQNYRFQLLINGMAQGLCMFNRDRRLIVCNDPYLRMYGLSRDAIKPGMTNSELVQRIAAATGSDVDMLTSQRSAIIKKGKATAFTRELGDGRVIAIRHMPMEDGGWVATHEDITEQRRSEAQIAHMAHHEALTGLPNRVRFREEMDRALTGVRKGEKLAVLCLDLDHFKAVNDTLGHPIGDTLLKAVAGRLSECLRDTDTIARLGGDEFAIIQVDVDQPNQSIAAAERIIERLTEPFDLDGHHVVIGTSVGIAVAPSDGRDPDQLLKSADMALYRAKMDGRGTFRFFESEMDAKMQARRELELDLRRALANGEFELFYQPLVNVQANRVTGFEALLRWNHPTRGRVPPADFIPLAEEIGQITKIGAWVLKQACTDAVPWPPEVKVAVNLSPVQFRSRTLVLDVIAALGASGLPGNRLELEVTETIMLQDTDATLTILHQLRELGVSISMDDFGTGYSSLSYLRKFPFDKIKIDQSFVRDLDNSLPIIRAVTGLSAGLGMSTTAEGVETEAQLHKLRLEGCTEVQGYLFSQPRPASEVAGLLASVPAKSRACRIAAANTSNILTTTPAAVPPDPRRKAVLAATLAAYTSAQPHSLRST